MKMKNLHMSAVTLFLALMDKADDVLKDIGVDTDLNIDVGRVLSGADNLFGDVDIIKREQVNNFIPVLVHEETLDSESYRIKKDAYYRARILDTAKHIQNILNARLSHCYAFVTTDVHSVKRINSYVLRAPVVAYDTVVTSDGCHGKDNTQLHTFVVDFGHCLGKRLWQRVCELKAWDEDRLTEASFDEIMNLIEQVRSCTKDLCIVRGKLI